jgi:hypothetical protein
LIDWITSVTALTSEWSWVIKSVVGCIIGFSIPN